MTEPAGLLGIAPRLPRRVFLDTNLIVNVVARESEQHAAAARMFGVLIGAAACGTTHLYVSPLVLDEVWWKLGEVLYDGAHGPERRWRRLAWDRRKEALEEHAETIAGVTRRIVESDLITVTDVRPEDASVALRHAVHASEPHLAPRDAFHLAVMQRLGIEAIVTNDPDFANAPGIVAIPYAS